MESTWSLLKKELRSNNIVLKGQGYCIYEDCQGNEHTYRLRETFLAVDRDISIQKNKLCRLWRQAIDILCCRSDDTGLTDEIGTTLFIFSLKDSLRFLYCFEDLYNSTLLALVKKHINKDIIEFSSKQIYNFPNYKIAIDWVARDIMRLMYLKKLIRFTMTGTKNVSQKEIKMAIGVSGPWANLDLPMLERVFPWDDIDSDIRGRSRDIRKQRRYRKYLDNYHSPGVGEGHYWRELRNEPFSWYDRQSEDPYYQRYLLTRN